MLEVIMNPRADRHSMARHLLVALATVSLTAAWFMVNLGLPRPVAAHCTGIAESHYLTAQRNLATGNLANGLKATIEWDNPTNCIDSLGVVHSLAILKGFGFVEVGWVKRAGMSGPRGICVQQHPDDFFLYEEFEFPITSGTYQFKLQYITGYWHCSWAGSSMRQWSLSQAGFSSSDDLLQAFGETEQRHGQLGGTALNHLVFAGMYYKKASGSTWYVMNHSIAGLIEPPYGAEIPSTTKFEIWTNAH